MMKKLVIAILFLAFSAISGFSSAQAPLNNTQTNTSPLLLNVYQGSQSYCGLLGGCPAGEACINGYCYYFVDICAQNGWYGDGWCDTDCPNPDPDCSSAGNGDDGTDFCAAEGWYGDGVCDENCPNPDPDCSSADNSGDSDDQEDVCAAQGWYNDGVCDIGCPNPDPDCGA